MKYETMSWSVARLFAALVFLSAPGCVAEPDDSADESVEQQSDAVSGDPCDGQPDSELRGYPYYQLGYGCVEQGAYWGYELKYCRGGQTQLLDCVAMGRYCIDYSYYGPGYGAYCEDLGY
jgi:hypothetical protein